MKINKYVLPGCLIGLGAILTILICVLGFVVLPDYINSEIEKTFQLSPNTDTWDDWVVNPMPVYLKFYIWHVENPDCILEKQTPNLTQKGPYIFSEIRQKIIRGLDVENDTVTYKQRIFYFFEESLSVDANGTQLSLNDVVNVVNLPFIAISTTLASLNIKPLDALFYNQYNNDDTESFVKKGVTINQVLFEGWEIPGIYSTLLGLADEIPPEFADGKFGYYRNKNGSDDGIYVIKTGLYDSKDLARIVTWENQTQLNWWENPSNMSDPALYGDPKYCNQINGTDGGVFPPFLDRDEPLYIYVTDICRSVVLVYVGEAQHRGITGYKYQFPDAFFQHPDDNPANYCFCPSPEDDEMQSVCTAGIIRLFKCQGGPTVTSNPHFYGGDPNYANRVLGMNPVEEEHNTYLVLQPDTGVPLVVRKRLQISIEIQPFEGALGGTWETLDYIMFPILWVSEETELTEELADELNGELLTPMKIIEITTWVLIAVGAVLLAVGGVLLYFRIRSKK